MNLKQPAGYLPTLRACGSFDRGTISPEPPKPELASMLTHASLIQSLLPQPLKTEHPKAPNPKTPVAMQILFMLKIEMFVIIK
jgi:hypothetical protein